MIKINPYVGLFASIALITAPILLYEPIMNTKLVTDARFNYYFGSVTTSQFDQSMVRQLTTDDKRQMIDLIQRKLRLTKCLRENAIDGVTFEIDLNVKD